MRVVHAPRMKGTFSPSPRVSDPDMRHGTCVTHVPWCMSGSLNNGSLWSRWRENFPGLPGACATHTFMYLARDPCKIMTCHFAFRWVELSQSSTSPPVSLRAFHARIRILRGRRPISGETYFRHICFLCINFMQLLFFVWNRFLI